MRHFAALTIDGNLRDSNWARRRTQHYNDSSDCHERARNRREDGPLIEQ